MAKNYSTELRLAEEHRGKSSLPATNSPKTHWREELIRLEHLDLPLVATGAESPHSPGERKSPADLRTGSLLKGWPTAKHSVSDIQGACDAVISVGTRTGADAHGLLVLDIDGETALDWLAARGLYPAAVPTLQIHRDTDSKRLKVAFQLTEQQQQELGQIKTKVDTKPPVKDDAGNVITKGEAVEIFHQGCSQVIVLGQHYKSKGNYFWPEGMGPEDLALIPENWWQAVLEIASTTSTATSTRSSSTKSSSKDWQSLSDCPICGRNSPCCCAQHKDGKTIRCFHGSTFAPPTGLKKGELHTDRQGTIWAYSKTEQQSNGDVFSTFVKPDPDKQLSLRTSKTSLEARGDEPSRNDDKKICYTEVIEQTLLAIREGDEDTEMLLRAEIIGRLKRKDTQITAALFRLLTKQETGKPAGSTKKTESLDLDAIDAIDGLDALLDGFIPANDLALLYGAKGSGKTLAALAMAFAVIDGTGFLDHSKPAQQGSVLFIASDSGAAPLMAAMQDLGVADHPATRGADRSFHLWANSPNQGMESWCASINECVRLMHFVKTNSIKLVIIDSAKTICAKAGISYLDNDSIAALLTFFKEVICVHASVMIISHDGTEKDSHSGAKVWAEVPSIVHNIQQVPDVPDARLWRVVKNRMGSLRQLRYQVGEDGGLEVCEGVETIGDATSAVIQVLTEAASSGITSLSRAGIVHEIVQRFRLAPRTIDNTLQRLARSVKPPISRVTNKKGHYKLSSRLLADISSNSSIGISPKVYVQGKKPS